MKRKKITIIGQCYNEEATIQMFYDKMCEIMNSMSYVDFEIIFIDDHSRDKSLEIIKKLAKKDDRIKYLSMSRNFGKDVCSMAGFREATGDYVTTMDLDLQDPPELLPMMYHALENEGYDMAPAKALTRKGYSILHKLFVKVFYKLNNKVSSVKLTDGQRDYCLMTRQVVDAILKYSERGVYNKWLWNDVGFKIKWIEYENVERVAGKTKFKFKRLMNYAVNGIVSFSKLPVLLSLYTGIGMFLIFIILTILIIIFAIKKVSVNLVILILIDSQLFFFSILLAFIGIISLYICQIHIEVKNRPLYIIKETNLDK